MPGQEVEQLVLAQDLMQHLAVLRPFLLGRRTRSPLETLHLFFLQFL